MTKFKITPDELNEIYAKMSHADKPRTVTGNKFLPQALVFYFLHEAEEAFSYQLCEWLFQYMGNGYGLNPSQLSRRITMFNSTCKFLNVEKDFYRDHNNQKQEGNLYSLDLSFLEMSK